MVGIDVDSPVNTRDSRNSMRSLDQRVFRFSASHATNSEDRSQEPMRRSSLSARE